VKRLYRILALAVLLAGAAAGLGQLAGCAAGLVAAGAAGGAMAMDRRSAGTIVDDHALELKIGKALNEDPALGEKAHINVTSYDYEVLLTGEAPTAEMRDRAVDIGRHMVMVKKVYNQISIAPPSDFQSRSRDTVITADVKARLMRNKGVSAANVKVVTEDRTVYLLGLVSHAEGDAATEAARFADNVAQVVPLFEYTD
jgi:osmotically-inducible protein OsmY